MTCCFTYVKNNTLRKGFHHNSEPSSHLGSFSFLCPQQGLEGSYFRVKFSPAVTMKHLSIKPLDTGSIQETELLKQPNWWIQALPCGSDVLTLFQSPVEKKKSYFANQSSLHPVFPVPDEFPISLVFAAPLPTPPSAPSLFSIFGSDGRILVASLIPEPLPRRGGGARHGSLLGVAAASLRLSHLVTDERGIQINGRGRRSSDPRAALSPSLPRLHPRSNADASLPPSLTLLTPKDGQRRFSWVERERFQPTWHGRLRASPGGVLLSLFFELRKRLARHLPRVGS